MSWSLPRLYLRPQRTSRSSELSVSRPDFCSATLRREVLSMTALCGSLLFEAGSGKRVTAVAIGQVTSDAPDRRDTDTRLPVNLAIGDTLLQEGNDSPAISECLQLGGRAQVAKESAA